MKMANFPIRLYRFDIASISPFLTRESPSLGCVGFAPDGAVAGAFVWPPVRPPTLNWRRYDTSVSMLFRQFSLHTVIPKGNFFSDCLCCYSPGSEKS